MKKVSTTLVGSAGLIYGIVAVLQDYQDAPFGLQAFIIAGVAAVGASAGWLAGFMASFAVPKRRTGSNQAV